jgi:HEAT repeat protein
MRKLVHVLLFAMLCLTILSGVVPGLCGVAPRADEEADEELVLEFKEFYGRNRSVRERIEAVMVLNGVDSLAATMALSVVFDDEDFTVRQAAIESIGSFEGADSANFLIETFITNKREKKIFRKASAAEALGLMGVELAVPPLVEMFKKTKEWELKRSVAVALGRIRSEEGIPVLIALVSDKDPTLRVVSLDALAEVNMPELTKEVILGAMEGDSSWQVRASAINAVRKMRFKDGIQPLIERLREEEGRLRGDAYEALKEITFNNYDDDPDIWQRFWDRARETYEVPNYDKVMAERKKRDRQGTRYSTAGAQFMGIPTKSKRIIFVIDISGSMETQVVEIERFRADGKDYDSFQRLEIVKTELINTIQGLGKGVEFNILAFATKLKWWKKRLVGGNILNRNSAVKFVGNLKPLGGAAAGFRSRAGFGAASLEEGKTNTFAALMAALGEPEESEGKSYTRHSSWTVDTVYFLSDGSPTVGKVIDQDEIRAEVKRVNSVRKIVLHTIAIGDFRKNFMKALAKDNNGVYVDLGK